jgi:hypothetical protein
VRENSSPQPAHATASPQCAARCLRMLTPAYAQPAQRHACAPAPAPRSPCAARKCAARAVGALGSACPQPSHWQTAVSGLSVACVGFACAWVCDGPDGGDGELDASVDCGDDAGDDQVKEPGKEAARLAVVELLGVYCPDGSSDAAGFKKMSCKSSWARLRQPSVLM